MPLGSSLLSLFDFINWLCLKWGDGGVVFFFCIPHFF